VGQNQQLVEVLKKCGQRRRRTYPLFLWDGGDGRTHLLQACCHEAALYSLRTVYLPLARLDELSPNILDGLEELDLICVDDVHMIAGQSIWEEKFFHAYNRIHDAGKRLIVTANATPQLLEVSLADVGHG